MKLKFKKISQDKEAFLPEYQTSGAAGMDFATPINFQIEPLSRVLVPLNLSVEIPEGYELQIRPRSGNALKFGVTVLNSPGTIDSDYRGEVGVILYNSNPHDIVVFRIGERIAQGVVSKYEKCENEWVEQLTETQRGEGGFGHTDKKQ